MVSNTCTQMGVCTSNGARGWCWRGGYQGHYQPPCCQSHQWTVGQGQVRLKLVFINLGMFCFLTDLSKSRTTRQWRMQSTTEQSFTLLRYFKVEVLLLNINTEALRLHFLERYQSGPRHCPCEHYSREWGRSLCNKHHQPLLWFSHHVTKVHLQRPTLVAS